MKRLSSLVLSGLIGLTTIGGGVALAAEKEKTKTVENKGGSKTDGGKSAKTEKPPKQEGTGCAGAAGSATAGSY